MMDVAAWVTASSSAGGAGILCMVLWWLFNKHLPAKDEQIQSVLAHYAIEREKDRELREEQAALFQQTLDRIERRQEAANAKLQEEFGNRDLQRRLDAKEALAAVLAHCDREAKRREDTLKVELSELVSTQQDTRLVLEHLRDERHEERRGRDAQPPKE